MASVLDSQQFLLYDAQWEAFRNTPLNEPLHGLECDGLLRMAFKVAREAKTWYAATPAIRFADSIESGTPHSAACAEWYWESQEGASITVAPNGQRSWVIAHEAAHLILMAGRPRFVNTPTHGPEYTAVYLWLVDKMFGRKYCNRLKRAFAAGGVQSIISLKEN